MKHYKIFFIPLFFLIFLAEIIAQPLVSVSPASLNATLYSCNDSIVKTITVYNTGTSNLTYSSSLNFVNVPAGYCVPTFNNLCSSADFINNFTFNTLNKLNSGCNGAANNYIFDQSVTTNVFPGSTYAMTMQAGSSYNQGFGVWIDYNQNGSFNDPGEFVYATTGYSTALYTTSVTIPTNAQSGKTMMRVRCRYNNTVGATDYCTNFSYGETEDYAISIGSPFLTVTPATGTILPGGSAILTVKFKSAGLEAGTHFSNLILATNDTLQPSVVVPCTLTFTGIPNIVLSSSNVNFGAMMAFLSHADTVLISNTGCAPLIISALNLSAGPFSVVNFTSLPDTILPLATFPLIVEFAPFVAGTFTSTLTITNNAAPKTVTLNGIATPPAQVLFSPSLLSANIMQCNDSVSMLLKIHNTGLVALNYQLPGVDTLSPWLSFPLMSGTIASGDSVSVPVKFKGSGLNNGTYTSYVRILTNDPLNSAVDVPCTFVNSGTASIMLSSANINYGILMANTTKNDTVLIHNSGCAPLIITALNLPSGPFSIVNFTSLPDTILPSLTVPLIVKYAPTSIGAETRTLTINSNDATKTISLNGTATPQAQAYIHPNPVVGTITHCNDSLTIPLKINNIGTVNLNYQIALRDSFYDNFENGLSKWTYASPWGVQQASFDGSMALTESPAGYYANYMNTSIEMAHSYKITDKQSASLSYMLAYQLESGYDNFYAYIKVNNGGWQQISGFTGGVGWAMRTYSLSSYVNSGDSIKIRFTITSDGSVTSDGVLIDDVKIFNAGTPAWIVFPALSGSLANNDSITIPVKFKGINLNNGTYTYNISVITNDPLQDTTLVPCVFHVNGQPEMTYTKTCIEFDSLIQYQTAVDSIKFLNHACGNLVISNITHSNSVFHIDTTYFSIQNGSSGQLKVRFSPLAPGHFYDTLNVLNNDSNIKICLHGFAKYPPHISITPDTLNIAIYSCNDSITVPVTINNSGNSALNYAVGNTIHPANCAPVTTGYCCSMGIFNVTFNSINNTTSPGNDGYKDYTLSQKTTVIPGNAYSLNVTTGTSYQENTRAWIDYNNNGDFESNELILDVYYHTGLCSQLVTIPLNSIRNIPLRMRVMSDYYYSAAPQPCVNVEYGQTEDYAIIILDGVTVPVVSGAVSAGDSVILNVKFSSHGLVNNTYAGNLIVHSNDPLSPIDTIPYTFVVNGTPDIQPSANSVDFDTIFQYNTKHDSILITNQGCTSLVVSNITHANAVFQIDSTSYSMLPGVSKKLHITFHPLTAGLFLDTLKIYNNDTLLKISLRGFAAQPPVMNHTPDSIHVSMSSCNDSLTVPVVIHNTGDANLIWDISTFSKNSLSFNGSNTYVDVPNYSGFPLGNTSVTVEAWVYPTAFPDPTNNGIVSYGYRGCTAYAFLLAMTNAGRPSFASWCNDFSPSTGPTASLNTWHHVAAVLSGNQITLYLDNYSWTSTLTYAPNIQSGNLLIGATDNIGRVFNGKIDEVRMWNYARSGLQITQNMHQNINPASSGLVSYWNFDEGSGATLNDLTGNGHTGTITGATWSTPSPVTGPYSINNTSGNIMPGGYDTTSITFYSQNLLSGTYHHNIVLHSNDPLLPIDTIMATLVFTGYPVIQVSKNCMEFDTLSQYSQKKDSVWIKNTGCDSLKITSITSTLAAFSVSSNVFAISPGDSAKLITTFHPVNPGNFIDTLRIFNNAGLQKICLHGYAYSPPLISLSPANISVTFNACDDSVIVPVTVQNIGDTILNWNISSTYSSTVATAGKALQFNGSSNSVDLGTWFNYQSFTIEMWVNPGTSQQQYADIIDNNHNGSRSFVLQQNSYSTNQYTWGTNDGGSGALFSIPASQWTHIAIVRDGNTKLNTVYINGLLQSSYTGTANITYDGTQFLRLGRWGGGSRYWNGLIDEVRIWNASKSQQQIMQNMHQQQYQIGSGLISSWNFNFANGTVIPDLTGNHNINNPGATLTTSSAPLENIVSVDTSSGNNHAGQSSTVNFTFFSAGLNSGTYYPNIIFNSNDPLHPADTIHCTMILNGYPVISTSKNCLAFDSIMQYTSTTDTFYIRNTGCDSLRVTNITNSSAAYQPNITTFNVLPGDSQSVIVTFHPLAFGNFHDTLRIISNATLQKICLNGYVYKPPVFSYAPDTIIANINNCNDSLAVPLTIYNTGDTMLHWSLSNVNNTALHFNGGNNFVLINNSNSFDVSHLTMEAWVYSDNFIQNGFIFEKGSVNSQYSMFFEGTNFCFRTYYSSGSGNQSMYLNSASIGITNGNWHHVAATYDGSTKKVYVDGVLKSTETFTGILNTGYQGQIIGAYGGSGGHSYYYNGNIQEVRVWNYARTQQQITQNMHRTISHNESGLVTYYDFHEGSGTVLNDITGHGNTGTVNGASWISPGAPVNSVISTNSVAGSILAGDTTNVNITFYSTNLATGTYHKTVVIQTNDPLNPVDTIPCILHFQGHPNVSFADTCIILDTTIQYTSSSKTFKIYNTGCDTLFVSGISSSLADISVNTLNVSINPGDSLFFSATFHPLFAQNYSGNITIHSNTADANMCIRGVSVLPPVIAFSPDSVHVNMTACNDTLVIPLVIKNTGNYLLSYSVGSPQIVIPSCTPGTTQYCCGVGITRVQLNTINNLTADGVDGYKDYTAIQTQVMAGQTYPVTIKTGTQFNENVCLWIDLNNNGTFELNEKLFESLDHLQTHAGNIIIPSTVVMQTPLRMRIGSDLSTNPTPQACVNSQFGQFEDYTVIIGSGISISGNTGNILAGDSVIVNMHINAQLASAGSFTFNIPIASNDPLKPVEYIPCFINISPRPAKVFARDTSVCFGNSTPNLISSGVRVEWFSNGALTQLADTGNILITGLSAAGIYTWYVTQTLNNCKSFADTVTLSIFAIPPQPTASDIEVCYGNQNTSLFSSGTNVNWYADALLSNLIFTGNTFNTGHTNVGEWIYYLTQTINGCTGSKDSVKLKINPVLTAPLVHDTLICFQSPNPVLTATGVQIKWYTDSALINLVHSGNNYTPINTSAGIHKYFVTQSDTVNNCESNAAVNTFSIFLPASPVSLDTAICFGQVVPDLYATGSNVKWFSDASLITLVDTGNIFATGINNVGAYSFYVTQTDLVHGCQSQANTTVLTIWGIPSAPITPDESICFGQITQPIISTGSNIIWSENSSIIHSGSTYTPVYTAVGSYNYLVTQTENNCLSPADTVIFTIHPIPVAPVVHDSTVCSGEAVPDFIAQGSNLRWYADNTLLSLVHTGDTLTPGVTNQGIYHWYVTQSIAVTGCEGLFAIATLTIDSLPVPPVVSNKAVCYNIPNPAFNATGSNVKWFADAALTTLLSAGNTFTSSETVAGTYSYYVTQTNNCGQSSAKLVTLTIYPIPAAPVGTNQSVCFGQIIPSLTAIGSNVYWYPDATLSTPLVISNTFTTGMTNTGTYTYYITQTVNACESPADSVTLEIRNVPARPISSDQTICFGTATPDLYATGINVNWYDAVPMVAPVYSGNTFSTGLVSVGTYTFYVSQYDSTSACPSLSDTVLLTIHAIPAAPNAADETICFGQPTNAINAPGSNVSWYSGTTLVHSGNLFTPINSAVGTYTYYATQTIFNCESPADTVLFTINAIPAAPVVYDSTVCSGTLTPNFVAQGSNIKWYSNSALTNLIHFGDTLVSGAVNAGVYTWYVTQTISTTGCEGPFSAATLTIDTVPNKPIITDLFGCYGTPNAAFSATGSNLYWYSDAALNTFLYHGNSYTSPETATGVYTYFVTQENQCGGSAADSATLTINAIPLPPFANGNSICFGQQSQAINATGSNITWYQDIAQTTILATTNSYTPNLLAPGTYTFYITQTVNACQSLADTAIMNIHALPDSPISHDTSTCNGNSLVLSAIGSNVNWYQDRNLNTLLQSGNNFTPTDILPATYVYFLTNTDNLTGCISNPDSVIFTITDFPVAPVAENVAACFGGIIPDFSATGSNIFWYSDASLATLVGTGNTFASGHVNLGSYTFYLTQRNECGVSPKDSATLTIGNQLTAPIAATDSTCFGSPNPMLTVVSNPGITVNWYNDSTLTQLVFTGNTYIPAQTAIGTYIWYATNSTTFGCVSAYVPMTLEIKPLPAAPMVSDTSICEGTSNPVITVSGTNVLWFSDPNLATIIQTGATYVPGMTSSGNYLFYITQTVNNCRSPYADVIFAIKPRPVAPVLIDNYACEGSQIPAFTASGTNITWYSEPAFVTVVGTGSSYQPIVSNAGIYNWYATQTLNGCQGPAEIATLTINSSPLPPFALDDTICSGGIVPVLSASGTNVVWYSNQQLTLVLQNGNNYQPTDISVGVHHFYVTQSNGSCSSIANDVSFVVFDASIPPAVHNASSCEGNVTAALAATGVSIKWYSDVALTNVVHSGNTFVPDNTLPGTYYYYATQNASDCGQSPAGVAISLIKQLPSAPVVTNAITCFGSPTPNLMATGANLKWYSEEEAIILVNIGSVFETGNTDVGTYTYYVTQTANGCTSVPNDISLTINPTPLVTLNKYHVNINQGSNVTLIAYNALNYTWSPASGLNTNMGAIVVASPANTTTYIVTGTNSQGCSDTAKCVVEVGQIGVDENDFTQFLSVYPNPTSGDLNIKYVSVQKEALSIKLMNQLGQILINKQSESSLGLFTENISMEHFADGVYYLQILAEKGIITKKIVLKR